MTQTLLYPKLAANGIKKNKQTYLPYILTCSGMIMIFYITSFLRYSDIVAAMPGGQFLQELLSVGCGVLVIFSAVFLFYTDSFLIRRRKKEFGLYNILGMGKKNIGFIMLWETVMIYLLSVVTGTVCGILFSKLAELFANKILGGDASYSFTFEIKAAKNLMIYFGGIFLLILLNSLRQIHLSSPIELLHSESGGEKPPRSNFVFALLGAVSLAAAYYMAVTIENPLNAVLVFFIAVIMVIIATYLLFMAGSVVICRLLQKNKSYYYKTNHFVSVSQMVYRMKRNGAGLASICILSTMVLVTLSSTICLYIGEEEVLDTNYPRDIIVDTYSVDEDEMARVNDIVGSALSEYDFTPENILNYRYISVGGYMSDDTVYLDTNEIGSNIFTQNSGDTGVCEFYIIPLEDFGRLTSSDETLDTNDILLCTVGMDYGYDKLSFSGMETFNIRKKLDDLDRITGELSNICPYFYIIMPDMEQVEKFYENQLTIFGENASTLNTYYAFDLDCDEKTQIDVYYNIFGKIVDAHKTHDNFAGITLESKANDKSDFYALYGGLFFLGIIFGTVFICAAVLIMYYKQISEGYEDKSRFDILQKVGMSKKEIKQSINSQVLTVFFMPLIAAGVHTAFAFPIISRLLVLLSLDDTKLFAMVSLCCFGAFAVIYIVAYMITSRSYYNIVSDVKNR
jgi:putative ABC transport system permease protein